MTQTVPFPTAMQKYPTVRQSLLSSFDACALSTAISAEYEQGWSSHPQARGTLAHRVFAKGLAAMYEENEETIPADVATAILREVLRQDDVEPRDVVNLPLSEVKDLAWVVRKWANENRYAIRDLVDVEQRLNCTVHYPDGHGGHVERVLTGALDALFVEGAEADHAIVLDWKDTWGIPGPQEVSFGGYFQQRMYALLVMRNYPSVQRCTLREVYPRFAPGEPEDPGYPMNVRQATVWRSDLEEVEAELVALVERFDRAVENGTEPWRPAAKKQAALVRKLIREAKALDEENPERANKLRLEARAERVRYENMVGLWQPSPGAHCGFCVRPSVCPIHPRARGAGRVRSQQDAERVAAETIVAEASAKQGKAALKTWANNHGPVPVKSAKGVKVWGMQATTRTASPKPEDVAAELEAARREGRPPNVESLWVTSASSRFGVHNPKPPTDDASDDLMRQLEASLDQAQARKKAAQ